MKGELVLEDVGGLPGRNKFLFESGKLNTIESPNASGKTTILKGLAAILSLPCEEGLASEIARKMGLKSKSIGEPAPLVNVNANTASISLSIGEELRECMLKKTGEVSNKPLGNERFLLTSLLTRESEISRALTGGEGNFEWIVKEMSRAKVYEKERGAVERWLTSTQVRLQQLGVREKELAENDEIIRSLRKKIDSLVPQKNRIETGLARLPVKDPRTEAEYKRLMDESRELGQLRDGIRSEVERADVQLKGLNQEIETFGRERERWHRKVEELSSQLEVIAKPEEVKKWEKEAAEIEEKQIPRLNSEVDKIRGVSDLYELALKQAGNRSQLKCLLCDEGTLHVSKVQSELMSLRQKISKIQDDRALLLRRKTENTNRISEIKRIKADMSEQLRSADNEERTARLQLSERKGRLTAYETKLSPRRKNLEKLEDQVRETRILMEKIEKEFKKLGDEGLDLTEKLGRIREDIESSSAEVEKLNKLRLDQATEIVDGYPLPIDRAKKTMTEWTETLQSVKKHLDAKIYEQKRGAAKQFNSKIKELMKRLGFSEFQEIWMDEESYELRIVRRGGKVQPIASLSASEKYAIATLLQIAVKEAYFSEMPFFVVDEVVLDFDRDRVKGVLGYLGETAAERDWFVVVARIGETKNLAVHHG